MDLRSRLRQAGLRVTLPRLAVAGLVHDEGGHWTADELHVRLGRDGVRLTRATVYNVLSDLRDAGLVLMPTTGPGPVRYEWDTERHHHFVCRSCGSVEDVPAERPERIVGGGLPEGASVDDVSIVFRGLCGPCRRAA